MRSRKITIVFASEQNQYLTACARIRDICVTALIRRLVEVICRDQMVAAILDDGGTPSRRPSEHAYRRQRGEPRGS